MVPRRNAAIETENEGLIMILLTIFTVRLLLLDTQRSAPPAATSSNRQGGVDPESDTGDPPQRQGDGQVCRDGKAAFTEPQ